MFSVENSITVLTQPRNTEKIIKMRHLALLMVLAVLSAYNNGVQSASLSRSNLAVGWPGAGDRLLYRNYFSKAAYPNSIQSQDITYRGSASTRITSIRATEVGYTQYANAYIIAGGIGWSNATVRLTSARGYGYYYQVEFWGR